MLIQLYHCSIYYLIHVIEPNRFDWHAYVLYYVCLNWDIINKCVVDATMHAIYA